MNNLKTVILLIVVFIIGVSAIYWIYQSQIATNEDELLPLPKQSESVNELASPTPEPQIEGEQTTNQLVPEIQPEAGIVTQPAEFSQSPQNFLKSKLIITQYYLK